MAGTPAASGSCVRQIWCREKRLMQSIGLNVRGTQAISGKRNLTPQMLCLNGSEKSRESSGVSESRRKLFWYDDIVT